jgi:hypothetical protein
MRNASEGEGRMIAEIMSLSVETLAERQLAAYKRHVITVLKEVTVLIEQDKYADVRCKTFLSPAGDGYGCENSCINFGWDTEMDIMAACETLAYLHRTVEGDCNGKRQKP